MNENNNFTGRQPDMNEQQGFNQPQQSFEQPQQSFEQPQQSFNQPQQSFGQPQQESVNQVKVDLNKQQNENQIAPDFGQQQNVNEVQPDFDQQQNENQIAPDFGQQQSEFGIQQSFNQTPMPQGLASGGNMPNNAMQYQQPKKNKAGLIIGVIAVLVIVALALLAYMVFKGGLFGSKPENMLQKGVDNITQESKEYNTGISEKIGLEELKNAYEEEPSHTNFNFAVTVPSEENINNVGIEFDAISDKKNDESKYNLSLSMSGADLSVGELFVAGNKLIISAPLFFEDVYSIDTTNLAEDFNNSAWAELFESELPEDFEFDLSAKTKEKKYEDEIKTLIEEYKELTKDIVKYSINKEPKEIYINDENKNYTGITISYNKDELNTLIENFKNDFMSSNYYNFMLEQYSSAYAEEEAANFEDAYNEIWNKIFGISFEEDFNVNVYFDKKGRIVNVSTQDIVPISGSGLLGIGLDFTFSGETRTLDEISGSIDIETEDGIESVLVNRFGISNEATYTEYIDIALVDALGEEYVSFTFENNFDKEESSFDIEVSVEANNSELCFVTDGYFTDINKGEGYVIQVDNASLGIKDEVPIIEMTGSITNEISDEVIEIPEDSIDLFDLDETEINALIRGSRSNIYN